MSLLLTAKPYTRKNVRVLVRIYVFYISTLRLDISSTSTLIPSFTSKYTPTYTHTFNRVFEYLSMQQYNVRKCPARKCRATNGSRHALVKLIFRIKFTKRSRLFGIEIESARFTKLYNFLKSLLICLEYPESIFQ